jgi:hypothetical protein
VIAPDNKLLQKLTRRVREAQASSPSVEAVWLYAETPLPGSLQDLIVEGVSVRSFGPGAVLPPEARR